MALDFTSFGNVINGKVTTTPTTQHGTNPSTGEALPPVPVSTPQDIEAAIKAARAAFPAWRATPVEKRKEALRALAAALAAEKTGLARMLTREQGKSTPFAEMEVDHGVGWLTGTTTLTLEPEVVEKDKIVTYYEPLGVAVGIVPWNFPIMLLCGKLGPCLVTGNCIIVKPSPFTPYCGIKIVELAQQFFPPGVVQVLSGDDSLGPQLTEHPGIDKISFTGSTATGKLVMRSAAKNLTRVTLELGGKDAAIVYPDVDVAAVAPQIAACAFMNAGQICIAIKRIYVHASIYDQFRDAFVAHVKTALQVGDGLSSSSSSAAGGPPFVGPVQNKPQYTRVQQFLEDIAKNKQTVLTGGRVLTAADDASYAKGFFVQPTVVDRPPDDSMIVQEEPFGPVVPLLSWTDEDEVVARHNASDMGLGASVWTNDKAKAEALAHRLEAGSVWYNRHLAIQPTATFCGHKKSGIGHEWGVDGLRAFCNTKTIFL